MDHDKIFNIPVPPVCASCIRIMNAMCANTVTLVVVLLDNGLGEANSQFLFLPFHKLLKLNSYTH